MKCTKKWLLIVLFVSVALLLVGGCAADNEEPIDQPEAEPISGTIYRIEDNRILVVGGLDDVNVPWDHWFNEGYRAVFFALEDDTVIEENGKSRDAEFLSRGQKVDVYHVGALAESYPEQGKADKVVVTDSSGALESHTDSGRFAGISEEGYLAIKISGVPDELPASEFRLTDEASSLLEELALEEEQNIIFYYLSDDQSDGLIYDLARLD